MGPTCSIDCLQSALGHSSTMPLPDHQSGALGANRNLGTQVLRYRGSGEHCLPKLPSRVATRTPRFGWASGTFATANGTGAFLVFGHQLLSSTCHPPKYIHRLCCPAAKQRQHPQQTRIIHSRHGSSRPRAPYQHGRVRPHQGTKPGREGKLPCAQPALRLALFPFPSCPGRRAELTCNVPCCRHSTP